MVYFLNFGLFHFYVSLCFVFIFKVLLIIVNVAVFWCLLDCAVFLFLMVLVLPFNFFLNFLPFLHCVYYFIVCVCVYIYTFIYLFLWNKVIMKREECWFILFFSSVKESIQIHFLWGFLFFHNIKWSLSFLLWVFSFFFSWVFLFFYFEFSYVFKSCYNLYINLYTLIQEGILHQFSPTHCSNNLLMTFWRHLTSLTLLCTPVSS